jgi:hypothetical protein
MFVGGYEYLTLNPRGHVVSNPLQLTSHAICVQLRFGSNEDVVLPEQLSSHLKQI